MKNLDCLSHITHAARKHGLFYYTPEVTTSKLLRLEGAVERALGNSERLSRPEQPSQMLAGGLFPDNFPLYFTFFIF